MKSSLAKVAIAAVFAAGLAGLAAPAAFADDSSKMFTDRFSGSVESSAFSLCRARGYENYVVEKVRPIPPNEERKWTAYDTTYWCYN